MPLSGENMIANFLIGLREGLEAALIVGILVAYAKKSGRTDWVNKILIGVVAAIATSVIAGLLLTWIVEDAEAGANQVIGGLTSIVAVVFVTWMIFWMANNAKNLSGDLRARFDGSSTTAFTVVSIAFFAVVREGVETSIFLWSSVAATGQGFVAVLGALIGLVVAAWLGYLIYRGALRMNLSIFFKYTGIFLIIVAAGILAYGFHELQEINLFPFLTATTFDVSSVVVEGEWLDVLLKGTISFRAAPSQLETVVWVLYASIVGFFFARAYRKPVASKA
jgi:high-affinity iron transporter